MIIRTMAKVKALMSLWYRSKEDDDGEMGGKGRGGKKIENNVTWNKCCTYSPFLDRKDLRQPNTIKKMIYLLI